MPDPIDDEDEVAGEEAAGEEDANDPTPPSPRVMQYPGALDQRLLTPSAPLPPGAGIRVYPGLIDPFPEVSVPPVWAPDPGGLHQWRWWDGRVWTDHVADDGEASEDPLP